MKVTFLLILTLLGSQALMADLPFSSKYEACAETKKEALYALSESILSRVSTSTEQEVLVTNSDDVQSKVSSYSSSSTNLSLVEIKYNKVGEEFCAVVYKDEQIKNTKKLLKQALLYETKNLPSDIDSKIEKLSLWLSDIKQLSFLIPAFLKDEETTQEQNMLNAKEKTFRDIYTASIAHSESLFFKSCKQTKEDAKVALNKKLFLSKKTKEQGGFLDSLTSIIPFTSSSDDENMLEVFDAQLIHTQKDKDECVMLKKEELKNIAANMYADMMRISQKSLSQDSKKRYAEINNLYEQLKVTKALMKLFPELYRANNFTQLDKKRMLLSSIQKKTYPQFVLFRVSGAENIKITLDNIAIKNNEKKYLKNGEHFYKITAKGVCPLVGEFSNDLKEDYKISKDLENQRYPTVTFLTDKNPNIAINGKMIKPNVRTTIKECQDTSRYIAKFAGQSLSGEINTSPAETNTVELNFLTSQELLVFNDAKTKKYTTTSETKFSESLTPITSEQLRFIITREPLHGELTLHESGSFQYVSEKDYVGMDNFEYEIESPQKTSAPKLVSISINVNKSFRTTVALPKEPEPIKEIKVDANQTENKVTSLVKEAQDIKESVQNKISKVSYEDFKKYVDLKELSGELNAEFLEKIQKKFPDYFQKLVKEKTK
ncbi:MAG: hypothetical protein Q9M40_13490 [Sulfurimonas sp.]|nr:hypothetical protein [Sulfurimonas sp.]